MRYKIAITEPVEFNGKIHFGVTVEDENGQQLYVERFYDEVHATKHVERLTSLIRSIGGEV